MYEKERRISCGPEEALTDSGLQTGLRDRRQIHPEESGSFQEGEKALVGNIMIQGTMSNVGKSLLCAALCRVLRQDGYRTAPFKSQNMALNSGVTPDGLEMGRAQILQAFSAGREADVRMNPVLLKPADDHRSQVIVNGEVLGCMSAREYFGMRKKLLPGILKAYRSLEEDADVIVIEGAGSPAEINLKKDDIANMGIAELVDAPVLLAGDIDPGGVFAQLYGTVKLLEPGQRSRIKGLVINKFRGDVSLLEPGLKTLEEMLGIPVIGVLPWMDLDLEEEDSLSPDLARRNHTRPVDIAVIRFPRISNFTDLDPLILHPLLGVRYVREERELGAPDLIILPGTKSTLADLRWLRESSLADRILDAAKGGTHILGICGGYQMLGETLSDPDGTEGEGTACSQGLGLLPARTIFRKEKTRRRVQGQISEGYLSGAHVYGYEIHTGRTEITADNHAGRTEITADNHTGRTENFSCREKPEISEYETVRVCARGNVCGTYLHGLFDSGEAVDCLAKALARKKGLKEPAFQSTDRNLYRDQQLDLLADAFRRHMDMERIYRIIERKEHGSTLRSD